MNKYRVQCRHGKGWAFWAVSDHEMEALEAARQAWRRGAAGVRVTRYDEHVILERLRDD